MCVWLDPCKQLARPITLNHIVFWFVLRILSNLTRGLEDVERKVPALAFAVPVGSCWFLFVPVVPVCGQPPPACLQLIVFDLRKCKLQYQNNFGLCHAGFGFLDSLGYQDILYEIPCGIGE